MMIYVAGASRELDRVEAFITVARLRGHELTHDWTVPVRASRIAGKTDADHTDEEAAAYASEDLQGIVTADAFVLLAPAEGGSGAWAELGFALGSFRGPILVAGEHCRRSVFTRLAHATCLTDDAALMVLDKLEQDLRAALAEAATWTCRVCGCTNARPCEGGCSWAQPNLCDRCVSDDGPLILGVR